jgi:hypothetical protein
MAYRAFSNDSSYTSTAQVRETVRAGVSLTISPRTTSPKGKIELSGHVQGPIPQGGTIVEVLVHHLGHGEPIRDPRTNSHGYFHLAYQFQDAIGQFPFRVENGQANFPYTSSTISVST